MICSFASSTCSCIKSPSKSVATDGKGWFLISIKSVRRMIDLDHVAVSDIRLHLPYDSIATNVLWKEAVTQFFWSYSRKVVDK